MIRARRQGWHAHHEYLITRFTPLEHKRVVDTLLELLPTLKIEAKGMKFSVIGYGNVGSEPFERRAARPGR